MPYPQAVGRQLATATPTGRRERGEAGVARRHLAERPSAGLSAAHGRRRLPRISHPVRPSPPVRHSSTAVAPRPALQHRRRPPLAFFSAQRYRMSTPPTSGSGAGVGQRTRASRSQTLSTDPTPTPSDVAAPSQGTGGAGTAVVNIEEEEIVVGNKRKQKSEVWNDFKKIKVAGGYKAECNWCHKRLSAGSNAGTNHLRGHLNICESRLVRKDLKQSTLKYSKNKDGSIFVEKYVFDQDIARKELALMICVHEYPLSIVDHVGFRKFCAALQPLFKVVSRNTIRKDILDMYEVQKLSLMNSFQQGQSRIAVTTDMWTANHQKKGYMAVTVHYIDDNWNLKSYLLRFLYVPHPHNAEVISEVLHDILCDWRIEKKVSTITLDNCSTNDNVMKELQDKMPLSSLMLRGRLIHMRCAAHIINLAVKDGMGIKDPTGIKVMEEAIGRVRETIGFWSATPKRHERFEKAVAQEGIKYEKRIALDVKTRWNSTYLMLSIALNYIHVFDRLAKKEKLCAPFQPTEQDWKFARYLCDRLKIFYDTTELLSATSYVTANLFFPKVCGIYLAIKKWQTSDNPIIEEMSAAMKEKFMKYWADVHGLMAVATVLDPRYKMKFLYAMYSQIYGPDGMHREIMKVRDLLADLVKEYQSSMEGFGATDGGAVSTAQNEGDVEVNDIFDQYLSSEPVVPTSYASSELDLYLEENVLPRTMNLDIISWWNVGALKFPTLRKIARDIMAIPVTTVASESVFSTSGRIISPHRSRLAPKMVEALMCMQAWSRADMLGILYKSYIQFSSLCFPFHFS
ncbi:hypothetical protein U9M48_023422 [Paspalum notatum var. saurae]|uniref:BED-type domain-containing protein n=1 Tax=Paspalum notatum var. saurae TaxID=547442 RepID=A0AAQ3TLY4_PASNO